MAEKRGEDSILYKRALEAALKDENISDDERRLLKKIKEKYSLFEDELDKAMQDGVITDRELEKLHELKERISKEILEEVVADGVVSEDEEAIVTSIFDRKLNIKDYPDRNLNEEEDEGSARSVYLPPHYLLLLIVPEAKYEKKIISTIKTFAEKKKYHGVYIGLRLSAAELKEKLAAEGVDAAKISIVDLKEPGESGSSESSGAGSSNTTHLPKEKALEVSGCIRDFCEIKETDFFIIDSFDELKNCIEEKDIELMMHNLFHVMRHYLLKGVIVCSKEKYDTECIKKVSKYFDQQVIIS